jgi:pimeloyl-ACP methyl ester carboxylesterase
MTDRAAELDQMTDHQAIMSLEREFAGWMVWREGAGRWLNSCFARCHTTDGGVSGEDWTDLRDQLIRATAAQFTVPHAGESRGAGLSDTSDRTAGMETVKSADGTVIAYAQTGAGPALIVSVGAFCTRHTFVAPPRLRERFTVVTYDRRGRGDSGDTEPFAPEREYEDLAAVAAAVSQQPPVVFGHSSGASIAMRAAAAGVPLAAVAAYEAPFATPDTPSPAVDPADHIRELVRGGRRDEAVRFWMADVVRAPAEMVAQLEGAPWAKGMAALAHTLPYDLAVSAGGIPTAELAKITVPVLVLGGADSPGWFRQSVASQAEAIPQGRLRMIEGYGHNAPPELITPILTEFFGTRG